MSRLNCRLALMGALSFLAYWSANSLKDLRRETASFEVAFFAIFTFYLVAVALVLRSEAGANFPVSPATFLLLLFFALAPRLLLLPMRPTLSDDMFRYIWDGRVQNHGLSPYRYSPDAVEVAPLRARDTVVWPSINRKPFVTVYPPGAQLAYAAIWRVVGDSVTGFKAAFVLAELAGAWLLGYLLRALGQPVTHLLIYLWSPLLIFEVAHAGHVDGLMLPLLILTFWFRVRERYGLLGVALGLATLVKLFPLILLPALLPPIQAKQLKPPVQMLVAFVATILLGYWPYMVGGEAVLGFLPHYFAENFNLGLAQIIFDIAEDYGRSSATLANLVTFGGLAVLSFLFILKPAASARAALTRCVWLIGWFTLFTQNLFPWYMLWLLPLIVCLVEPGKWLGFKLTSITAWLLFNGLIMLSYTFFIRWRVVAWAQVAEFVPLYALLLAAWFGQLIPAIGLRRQNRSLATTRNL